MAIRPTWVAVAIRAEPGSPLTIGPSLPSPASLIVTGAPPDTMQNLSPTHTQYQRREVLHEIDA